MKKSAGGSLPVEGLWLSEWLANANKEDIKESALGKPQGKREVPMDASILMIMRESCLFVTLRGSRGGERRCYPENRSRKA